MTRITAIRFTSLRGNQAHELAQTGPRVVAIDRLGGVGSGSTSSPSSIVRFHYSTFEGVAASWESKFGRNGDGQKRAEAAAKPT